MNKCTSCGAETKKNESYCTACGKAVAADRGLNDKKTRVMGQEKNWTRPLAIAAAVVVAIGALWLAKNMYMANTMGRPMFSSSRDASARLTKATMVAAEGDEVRIPLANVNDGRAHFFAHAAGGRTITFFAMKASDGSIRTAFDACTACNHAKLGYRQESDMVVCNNCGMGFKPADIGMVTGGCSPIPVNKSLDGQMLVLKVKDIENGVQYF